LRIEKLDGFRALAYLDKFFAAVPSLGKAGTSPTS
jgi:hypothetical protein